MFKDEILGCLEQNKYVRYLEIPPYMCLHDLKGCHSGEFHSDEIPYLVRI